VLSLWHKMNEGQTEGRGTGAASPGWLQVCVLPICTGMAHTLGWSWGLTLDGCVQAAAGMWSDRSISQALGLIGFGLLLWVRIVGVAWPCLSTVGFDALGLSSSGRFRLITIHCLPECYRCVYCSIPECWEPSNCQMPMIWT
jgi:hypothetical protein